MPLSAFATLQLAPLIASTCLLISNLDQVSVWSAWITPKIPFSIKGGSISPIWCKTWFWIVFNYLLPIYIISLSSTAINIYYLTPSDAARSWFITSFIFTALHLVFAPRVNVEVKIIMNEKLDGRPNLKAIEEWLRLNRIRFWTTDIPAFVTTLIATGIILEGKS
ncbi:hypothetical protein CC78DRAFT_612920 [Lojkania enalia]|uniref:Uncharacterized protein n=1 Tax=Lojkania enalia TaxID=147567 RepID=A0A9P4KH25_9PLEO|nr:hypothetical protein CC78DRAFT_612920 [Didymosphaeria enalia]